MLIINNSLVGSWVSDRSNCELSNKMQAIGWLNSSGTIVAGVVYDHYTGASVTATIAIDGAMSKEFTRVIFDYPLNQLGVKKILAHVAEDNVKSIGFLEKAGFVREATIPDIYEEGAMHIYTMTRDQCRWIGSNHG